ncbi:hypothetical protein [Sphingobium yanoikuyae]|uniref:hypothetical protein n=1 Tax=Sphingobium yanoikuyae TaxID=13690 RepID=UPI0026F1B1B2|nr:hypothetical protein [Sphingobium yanoikuyae]
MASLPLARAPLSDYVAPKSTATLSVLAVAPPAAPPEPAREVPPGPEQVQKEKSQPTPRQPILEPPEDVKADSIELVVPVEFFLR